MASLGTAFGSQGATPGVIKPKAMNPAMYGGGSLSVGGQTLGGSYNPNQGAISLGQNKGLISPHPTAKAETPLKKTTTTDTMGNTTTHEYHAEPKAPAPLAPPKIENGQYPNGGAPVPVSTNPATQIQNVGNAGQQTSNENQMQQGVLQAGQTTPDERAFQQQYVNSVAGKQFGTLAPYAEAGMYAGKTPEEIQGLITAPDLAGRAGANTGLYNALGSAYGNAALAGLTAAQVSAARGLSAAQSGYSGAQTQAQRGLGAQTTALNAGLLQPTAPGQIPFSQVTGQQGNMIGVGAGNGIDIPTLTQQVLNGQITYDQANSALGGNLGLTTTLRNAITQQNPNFNFAQSSTLAGQQGSIGVNYQLADVALNNVENIIKDLGALQTTNIPLVNAGANWISTQFGVGSEQTRAMTGAVQSLRNAYASLLASVRGGTPTDYSNQASAEIPNEPTPNDIAAIRQNFEVLGAKRKEILGNPGQAGSTSGTTSGTISWDNL